MKAISVHDLKLIPELSHLSIFDLVHPDNDKLVNPFLEEMGFDLDYALIYTVSQHRTLQNKVEIGYVIRGEVDISRKHLTGPWASLQDRMVAAAYTDPSLCVEMCKQMNTGLNFTSFHSGQFPPDEKPENFPECLTDPEEAKIVAQIAQLEDILLQIRGSQHKADGSRKLAHEYHIVEEVAKPRKRHKKRSEAA